ncbi:flagellar biosynthesis protein FlhF [Kaarinaea lacus]
MKTRKYFSSDLRSAVLAVRNELGSNAVILSHKKSSHGIEVIAAVEEAQHTDLFSPVTDNSNLHHPEGSMTGNQNRVPLVPGAGIERTKYFVTGTTAQNENINSTVVPNGNESCTTLHQDMRQCTQVSTGYNGAAYLMEKNFTQENRATQDSSVQNLTTQGFMDSMSMDKVAEQSKQEKCNKASDAAVVTKRNEFDKLVTLIEQQVTEHAWGDVARKNPLRAQLIRQLLKLDIHPLIIQRITDALSADNIEAKSIMPHALALIANQLPIYKEDITACGGTIALFGATGAGKTTTIAKMAARYALRHGREQVALVTTDNQRIAAHEQLRIYSDILGIPLRVASDAGELLHALNEFSEKTFVLIDTAGMGPKDIKSSGYQQLFSGDLSQVKNFLVLPATAHRSVLEQSANAFRSIKLDGSIITKLDETASLGGPLSVAILNNLPVAYYSNGQKIPDDFHLARAHILVSRAVGVADQFVEMQSVKAKNHDKAGIEANVSI